MKIRILAVAKKSSSWVRAGEEDFLSRIQNFTKVEIEHISPSDENSLGVNKAREVESEKLLKKLKADEFVIACEREGVQMNSEKFSAKIGELNDSSQKICFIIGGSNGLSSEVLARSNLEISFSKLTFPHELFRLLLLEQIYRAFMILTNRKYHK